MKILEVQYGHLRSARKWSAIDGQGRPIPWYTYPAIEYVTQFDLSNRRVFEYGAGNSTFFWSSLAERVVSVEDDEGWYQKLRGRVGENVALTFAPDKQDYLHWIAQAEMSFDVISIDGKYRDECAQISLDHLHPGGMIILDNSDWWVNAAKILREADLIQVDMSGFTPINGYTSTTSFFLHRDFRFSSRCQHQPRHSIGALKHYAPEQDLPCGEGA